MKFLKSLKALLVISLIVIPTNILSNLTPSSAQPLAPLPDQSLKASKFLFMYKYPLVQNEPNHKLNVFTYKNVLFSPDQIVYFGSTNEADPVRIYNFSPPMKITTLRSI